VRILGGFWVLTGAVLCCTGAWVLLGVAALILGAVLWWLSCPGASAGIVRLVSAGIGLALVAVLVLAAIAAHELAGGVEPGTPRVPKVESCVTAKPCRDRLAHRADSFRVSRVPLSEGPSTR
jgi:hypothetical protein